MVPFGSKVEEVEMGEEGKEGKTTEGGGINLRDVGAQGVGGESSGRVGEEGEEGKGTGVASKQGRDGEKGDIAAVEKSAEVTDREKMENETAKTRKNAEKNARANQELEVVEGDDQGEGGSVEETGEDAEPGVTGVLGGVSPKAVSEVEAQTANGTTTPGVENETTEQRGSADGERHGEVGQVGNRDASEGGMSASELAKQVADAAGSASISPDAETGNLEPASTKTDVNAQFPNDSSQSAELEHDAEDLQAGSSQSQHASGDGIQDNTRAADKLGENNEPGPADAVQGANVENAPPPEQGATSSLPPVVVQSGDGVEVTANEEQKSGGGGDQDDQDASKHEMASESGTTVYEPAVDDIENNQDGDGLTGGQSGIDGQGESAEKG
ncbi:hypothetical protein PILCRDRAFT_465258 [Piloderma croceum F 1598]|uniref:Uncharacterized protein n=1 Tax=Piloderma croceum (strain F 1598) TaxID=765440 RepID=A0A0C3FRZ7_PILCF|nr:hypothetical protein PILCRDRAFT_465258 [Piloderma croceum F 1598]